MTEDQDTTMTDPPPSSSAVNKKPKTAKSHDITTRTIKTPPFAYACLELMPESTSTKPNLDDLTVRSHIMAALIQFLGLSGSAISVDILKVEGNEAWVRVPREDLSPFLAAVGGWVGGEREKVGWRIKESGNWLGALVGAGGEEKIWSG